MNDPMPACLAGFAVTKDRDGETWLQLQRDGWTFSARPRRPGDAERLEQAAVPGKLPGGLEGFTLVQFAGDRSQWAHRQAGGWEFYARPIAAWDGRPCPARGFGEVPVENYGVDAVRLRHSSREGSFVTNSPTLGQIAMGGATAGEGRCPLIAPTLAPTLNVGGAIVPAVILGGAILIAALLLLLNSRRSP